MCLSFCLLWWTCSSSLESFSQETARADLDAESFGKWDWTSWQTPAAHRGSHLLPRNGGVVNAMWALCCPKRRIRGLPLPNTVQQVTICNTVNHNKSHSIFIEHIIVFLVRMLWKVERAHLHVGLVLKLPEFHVASSSSNELIHSAPKGDLHVCTVSKEAPFPSLRND